MNSTQIPQTFLDDKRTAAMGAAETKLENGKTVRPFEFRKIVK